MSASPMTIRAAEATDEPAWRRLWAGYNAFYDADVPEPVTAATWARILDPSVDVLARVAVGDGGLAGFSPSAEGAIVGFSLCVLHPSTWTLAPVCYLEDLFVDPAARGHGLGRALLQDCLDRARAAGWPRLYWHTREDNAAARRLYDGFAAADGFVRYRVRVDG